jgi:hypothetical protein
MNAGSDTIPMKLKSSPIEEKVVLSADFGITE